MFVDERQGGGGKQSNPKPCNRTPLLMHNEYDEMSAREERLRRETGGTVGEDG